MFRVKFHFFQKDFSLDSDEVNYLLFLKMSKLEFLGRR